MAAEHPGVRVLTVVTALHQASDRRRRIDDADSTLGLAPGITSFPTLYLVGPDGVVLHTARGEVDAQALDAAFTALEQAAQAGRQGGADSPRRQTARVRWISLGACRP